MDTKIVNFSSYFVQVMFILLTTIWYPYRHGLEGRSCLLRSICEVAETPIYYNGLIGELIHVILT